jgi:uncharacterized small protein (DUF1192 family)
VTQQVQPHLPEAVHVDPKTGMQSLEISPIVAALVEQVKLLTAEVERLKAAA